MSNKEKEPDFEATKALLFLTWADCHERLDYLLLEFRHLQENILYVLKEPVLYEILEHEQKYFPSQAYAVDLTQKYVRTDSEKPKANYDGEKPNPASGLDDTTYAIRRFVEEAILNFPAVDIGEIKNGFDKCEFGNYYVDDTICDLRKRVLRKCRELWMDHTWNTEQIKLYYLIRACQSVKQSLFEDKLWLVHYAKPLFSNLCKKVESDDNYLKDLRKFQACRAAVKDRMSCYVKRLGEMQSDLKGRLDIGLHDHTRPLMERHKEQNIFNRFLGQHCVTLQRQLNKFAAGVVGDQEAGRKHQIGTINIHSSDFDATSHYHPTNASRERYYFGRDSIHSITTSFWMPERPDLVPVIAHEAAHSTHHRFWGGRNIFSEGKSDFNLLMIGLERLTQDHDIYREIAIDMLALVVQGPAYLYALFLELFCHGEERVFSRDKQTVDVSMNQDEAFGFLNDLKYVDRQWYVRVKVACHWMNILVNQEQIYTDPEKLTSRLISGINSLCDDFLKGVMLSLREEDRSRCKNELDQLFTLTKGIIDKVVDGLFPKEVTASGFLKQLVEESESHMPLDAEVSNFLCRGLIRRKRLKGEINFKDIYGLTEEPECPEGSNCDACQHLQIFRNLQDIPWECSILRGLDAMHSRSSLQVDEPVEILNEMAQDLSLGREYYQIAIDFHLMAATQPYTVMSDIVRAVSSFTGQYPETAQTEIQGKSLLCWLEKNNSTTTCPEEALLKSLTEKDASQVIADEYSARAIGNAFVYTNDSNLLRKLADIYCFKLVGLHKLIGNFLEAPNDSTTTEEQFAALRTIKGVLQLRFDSSKSEEPINPREFRKKAHRTYLNEVCSAFKTTDTNGCKKDYPQDVFTLGRMCMSSVYRLESMDEQLCFTHGHDTPEDKAEFIPLLGRYDHFVMEKSRPMFRNRVIAQKNSNATTPYVPYFVRWETAVPLSFGPKQDCTDKRIVGLLSVTMDRTELRLDMVHRLKNVLETKVDNSTKGYFEVLGNLLKPKLDRVFLSDGWGDLLIIFYVEVKKDSNDKIDLEDLRGSIKERLPDIFEIQNSLYQDFLVERTELILTPGCFDVAVRDYDNYRCSIHMRLQEDKTILPGNRLFVAGATNKLKSLFNDATYFTVTKTPGRFDFFCRLCKSPQPISDSPDDLYKKMTGALLRPYDNDMGENDPRIKVDRLQTNVKKVEYSQES